MSLYNFIKEKIFPTGFEDTMCRLKPLEQALAKGKYRTNYFYEKYDDEWVKKHCAGEEVLAAYAINGAGLSCWVAFDIDCHKPDKTLAEYNLRHALEMSQAITFENVIEKSNDIGGFHLWIFPDDVITGFQAANLVKELFPTYPYERRPMYSQCAQLPRRHGANTLRLPGKHPKYKTFSKFRIDDKWVDVREL